ncbi:TetR/AcrR family transcriptional regulator [Desulfoluna butyratoxydans]|uniref:Dna-binding hth domain tetr-type n=1 Tax=Desulfoluna butyratoxydans TaxID=231438 RepID=A0A4U8YIS6_9BACT|nr:TetR/AcrR family transcriptional regulator [Desulfoluna butyratoxydans]VFQ43270.1 dna-binding hth domain tetr-type [Desulfoluna butyratoxydans]
MNQGTQQTRKPVQQRGIRTKDKILKAAEGLFAEKGFHKTNTKEIAAEAGVATGSVYAYFKDKKSVFLEIYGAASHASFLERACRDIDFSEKTNREAILALLQRLAKEHTLSPGFRREVAAMRASDKDVEAIHARQHDAMRTQLVDTLGRREKALRVTDLDAAAFVILCACEEVMHACSTEAPGMAQNRLLDALADMVARYVFR